MFGGAWRLYDTKVVQSLNHVWLSVTLWAAPCQASLSFTISWSLLRLMAIESLMPPNHLILSCPLLLLLSVFPSIGSFPISQLFASGGQSIRASASASVLPKSIQSWFPLGWTGWISLQSKGLSRVFSSTTVWKHPFFSTQPFFFFFFGSILPSIHDYWKSHSFDYTDLFSKVMSLLFNMLSRFVITEEGNGKPL